MTANIALYLVQVKEKVKESLKKEQIYVGNETHLLTGTKKGPDSLKG